MSELHDLVQRFIAARRGDDLALVEGYHALKHALRFGARIVEAVAAEEVNAADLPPEVAAGGLELRSVDSATFDRCVHRRPPVAVAALARRVPVDAVALLTERGTAPVVLLERPTHLGNVGAAIRVAAAADAAGLVTTERNDPWHPEAIRGSAGLHFALPPGHVDDLADVPGGGRPVVAFDTRGEPYRNVEVPTDAVLAFGTEARGISNRLRERADAVVRLAMRPGVSSLNLATSVAVALYTHPNWLAGRP